MTKKANWRKKPRIWTEAKIREEARKYKTVKEFRVNCNHAYHVALKNGWLSTYDWLKMGKRPKWTEERVLEEAKKYCCGEEFLENCQSGWRYAKKTGVYDKITWFIKITPEFKRWMGTIRASIYRLLTSVGLEATKQWLFIESGKSDVYTVDQCKLLKRWSEIVTENWAAWKKFKWYYYDDMNYEKRRLKGDKEEDMDDGLHIKP